MQDRHALHTLVDELPEPELAAAKRFLEYLRQQPSDSLRLALDAAPLDDEPVTEDDLAAIREGFEEQARGETVSHEEVKRLLREAK
jgi:predicted transcriptional regulator